ncbi:MAG: MmcQ/YjbR family DNA-binding protein, partial [Thermoleophilia bacterium]|nr:MmcQ/YjbR family DNA-binding protein [Thermoleophilia bacterium]
GSSDDALGVRAVAIPAGLDLRVLEVLVDLVEVLDLVPELRRHALSIEGALPSGYGLGKAGWVTVPSDDEDVDLTLLCDWVEESYRIVAPKRLVALLDAASG